MKVAPLGPSPGNVAGQIEVFALSKRPGFACLDAWQARRARTPDVPIIIKKSVLNFLSAGGSLCSGCTCGRLLATAGSPHGRTSYAKRTFARSIYQMLCTQKVLADCGRRGTMRGEGRRRRVLTIIVDR
jgi:hypothetical protein